MLSLSSASQRMLRRSRSWLGRAAAALIGLALLAAPAAAQLAVKDLPSPKVTTFKLKNGLDIVVIEDHRAPVVTHMVWYRVGSG